MCILRCRAALWHGSRHDSARTPYVLTAHLGDVPGGVPEQTDHLYRIVKPFTVPIWRSAAAVTAVAPHVAELAEQAYGIKPRVILNGSDAVMSQSQRQPYDGPAIAAPVVWTHPAAKNWNRPRLTLVDSRPPLDARYSGRWTFAEGGGRALSGCGADGANPFSRLGYARPRCLRIRKGRCALPPFYHGRSHR